MEAGSGRHPDTRQRWCRQSRTIEGGKILPGTSDPASIPIGTDVRHASQKGNTPKRRSPGVPTDKASRSCSPRAYQSYDECRGWRLINFTNTNETFIFSFGLLRELFLIVIFAHIHCQIGGVSVVDRSRALRDAHVILRTFDMWYHYCAILSFRSVVAWERHDL